MALALLTSQGLGFLKSVLETEAEARGQNDLVSPDRPFDTGIGSRIVRRVAGLLCSNRFPMTCPPRFPHVLERL